MRDGQLIRPEGRISTIAEINEATANAVPQDLGYRGDEPRRTWEDGNGPQPSESPVAAFGVVVEGLTVSVDATPSFDPEEWDLQYSWSFGDSSEPVTGVTAEHTYEEDGVYTVTLTVTDITGLSAVLSMEVTVAAPEDGGGEG